MSEPPVTTDEAAPEGFNLLTDVPQYKLVAGFMVGIGPWLDFSAQVIHAAERRTPPRAPRTLQPSPQTLKHPSQTLRRASRTRRPNRAVRCRAQ